jgi:small-conductance mechanosensitive channel
MDFLSQTFLGNSLKSWLLALVIFILTYVVVGLLGRAISMRILRLGREKGLPAHALLEDLLKRTNMNFVFLLALYLASRMLVLPDLVSRILEVLAVIGLVLQIAFWGVATIDFWIRQRVKAEPGQEAVNATTMGAVSLIAKIALWSVAVLIILQNITGMDLNALIAALGLGGLAVALAVQNILGDLFSSVSIAMDKPFVIGDDIAVDNLRGTVEYIGLKSTRLRSTSGEQLVFSNSDLLRSRIHNYQRLERRQVVLPIKVSYQTPYEKLVAIPSILKEIIETQNQITFDQAYFKEFSALAIVFECVYFVEVPAAQVHLDARQAIHLEICRRFREQGIELAYTSHVSLPD